MANVLTDTHGGGGEQAEVRQLAQRAGEREDEADHCRDRRERDRARGGVRERVQELCANKDMQG